MSVADTVLQCIAHKDKRHMLKLKNDFRLSDRRWCWLQVRGTRHPQHTHTHAHASMHASTSCAHAHAPAKPAWSMLVGGSGETQHGKLSWRRCAVKYTVARSAARSGAPGTHSTVCALALPSEMAAAGAQAGRSADSYSLIALRCVQIRGFANAGDFAGACARACVQLTDSGQPLRRRTATRRRRPIRPAANTHTHTHTHLHTHTQAHTQTNRLVGP